MLKAFLLSVVSECQLWGSSGWGNPKKSDVMSPKAGFAYGFA